MGRTVPSFRIVLAQEKQEWKPFRNALDKSERKAFDEMWDIPRLYISACSNSVQLVPLHPIMISILFHHYKELKEYIFEIEQLEEVSSTTTESSSKKKEERLTTKEEKEEEEEEKQEEQKQETFTTLDGYILLQKCDVVNVDGDNTVTRPKPKFVM